MTHNYIRAVLEHIRQNPASGVTHVEVRHEGNCGVFRKGFCNCEPVIESGSRVDAKHGGDPS